MTPLIQKENEKLHGMWRGESRWIMNYKCITNEPSRGLRTARRAQSIAALTRQWPACCHLKKRKTRRRQTSRSEDNATHTKYTRPIQKEMYEWEKGGEEKKCLRGLFVVWVCEFMPSIKVYIYSPVVCLSLLSSFSFCHIILPMTVCHFAMHVWIFWLFVWGEMSLNVKSTAMKFGTNILSAGWTVIKIIIVIVKIKPSLVPAVLYCKIYYRLN